MMRKSGMKSGMQKPSLFQGCPSFCIFVLGHASCIYSLRLPAFEVLRRMYRRQYKRFRGCFIANLAPVWTWEGQWFEWWHSCTWGPYKKIGGKTSDLLLYHLKASTCKRAFVYRFHTLSLGQVWCCYCWSSSYRWWNGQWCLQKDVGGKSDLESMGFCLRIWRILRANLG